MPSSGQIVIADGSASLRASLAAALGAAGIATVEAADPASLATAVADPSTRLVLASRGLALGALARVREQPHRAAIAVVVVVYDDAEMASLLEAGADDVVCLPRQQDELVFRVRAELRASHAIAGLAQKERDAKAMLELTQTLSSSLDFREILYTVVRRIADVVRVDRVSIVLSPGADDGEVGYVVAASDDQQISNLRIDLEKYPEIRTVLRSRSALTIHDASTHPLLEGVRGEMPKQALGALTLLPIVWQEEAMGVLFLRAAPGRAALSPRETDFCQIIGNATAVALRNARIMQTLRDQTQQVNFARFEAERRLRALKRYANLFTSAADGLAAVDPDGLLLFANPRAYDIVGRPEEELRGKPLLDLLTPADRRQMVHLWRGVRRGEYPQALDLHMRRNDGSIRVLSCSFASLLEGEGAVLFSFRDVTDERETAAELAKTKEFLESLIHATPDAIIAADLRGNILLFNDGAERIYGWRADEVIGKKHVTELYPPGGAGEVMRMLRAPNHGGVGRLEVVRFDCLDRDGKRIPINLSAAMIYDEAGKPFATVGIFHDLRERLRVEERLAQAQQKLAVSEKQALIAELAGTAAHELNQPLTSVIGYAELLLRKVPAQSAEHHAASVIIREAERMADIVRKIGKITRYETKSYVGAQKILDLDASAAEDPKQGTG